MTTAVVQLVQQALELPEEDRMDIIRQLSASITSAEFTSDQIAEFNRRSNDFEEHSVDFVTWFKQWSEDASAPNS